MKDMNGMLRRFLIVALLGVGLGTAHAADGTAPRPGTLTVVVQDENGDTLENAQVYVYTGEDKLIESVACPDTVRLTLAPATYRVYAAGLHHGQDFEDHLVSPDARITLTPGEPVSIVLQLHTQEDPLSRLTTDDLKRMGLDPHLIKDLN